MQKPVLVILKERKNYKGEQKNVKNTSNWVSKDPC